MRSIKYILAAVLIGITAGFAVSVNAQTSDKFQGTVISYGSGRNTRVQSGTFDLIVNGVTAKSDADDLMKVLDEKGQNGLMDAVEDTDLGRFSINSRIGPVVNLVLMDEIDGKTRVIAIFKRWIYFAEFRAGGRSLDYPFGVVEMYIDPKTGKGEGTYIGAAQLDWVKNKKTGGMELEVTGFATFPSKLLGVKQTAKRLP
jgi:hypothetical protein